MSAAMKPAENERQVRPFADFLLEQAGGATHTELSESLIDLVEAVKATGKKGALRLDVAVVTAGNNHDVVEVTARVTVKAPAADPHTSIFFTDTDGNLVRDNPTQPRLPLRDASTPPANVDPDTGEIKEAK